MSHIIEKHHMRKRGPHRENVVENILVICLLIVTMQHIRESPSASHAMRKSAWNEKECVAVFTVLHKKNGAVSYVGSDLRYGLPLYTANPQPIVVQFSQNKKENLSWLNIGNYINFLLRWPRWFILKNGRNLFLSIQ